MKLREALYIELDRQHLKDMDARYALLAFLEAIDDRALARVQRRLAK